MLRCARSSPLIVQLFFTGSVAADTIMQHQKKKKPTTRAARRGMPFSEWKRQNTWPRPELLARLAEGDSPGPQDGHLLHPEDIRLIDSLNRATGGHGVRKLALARLYYPEAADDRSAMAQLSYELRCCRGLTAALARLHHQKGSSTFTCHQAEQVFLLFGSPGC